MGFRMGDSKICHCGLMIILNYSYLKIASDISCFVLKNLKKNKQTKKPGERTL